MTNDHKVPGKITSGPKLCFSSSALRWNSPRLLSQAIRQRGARTGLRTVLRTLRNDWPSPSLWPASCRHAPDSLDPHVLRVCPAEPATYTPRGVWGSAHELPVLLDDTTRDETAGLSPLQSSACRVWLSGPDARAPLCNTRPFRSIPFLLCCVYQRREPGASTAYFTGKE